MQYAVENLRHPTIYYYPWKKYYTEKIMKYVAYISLITLTSGLPLCAVHHSLKIKNKTSHPIEFKYHTSEKSKAKIIEAGKSAHFSLDMSKLSGVDWQIPSAKNPECKDWYMLDSKSSLIISMRNQAQDSSLTIEENGSFQSVIGKSIQRI